MKKPLIKIVSVYFLIFATLSCQVAKKEPQNIEALDTTVIYDTAPDLVLDEVIEDDDENIIYQATKTKLHDLIHTRLEVSFDWDNKHLIGIAQLELKPYFYPQSKLELDAKGFELKAVEMMNKGKKVPLKFQYDGEVIKIDLGREYLRDESYFIELRYIAKPYDYEGGGSEAISSDRGLYFINADGSEENKPRQIWTQGETEANSRWFPTIDAPNERTSQEMYITVEENFTTLSNGTLIYSKLNGDGTKTDYWKMELPHAPYLFMMAIGEYAIVKDTWNNIEVDYYVEPEYKQYAKSIFGNTPEMMSFFSEKLKYPFPWPKYSQVVVRDFVSGAMENTSASTFMEALQKTDRELLDQNWDNIIAHELFHQWFGDLVTTESWSNLPLNESFANYSEYLWNEHKYGVDQADYEGLNELTQYLNEAKTKQVDLIRFDYEDKEDMFDSHSYAKGGRVLHMLRKYVGDDAFFASLQHYLKENEFKSVEIHDLRLAFERITGEDLNWFFNQWFLASGHPQLKVTKTYAGDSVRLQVSQNQDFETTPLYRLPLYVDVWVNNIKERYAIVVDKKEQTFSFYAPQKPNLVLFDAEKQLLGEIENVLDKDELIYQYNNVDKFLARSESIEFLSKEISDEANKKILLKAFDDNFWGIRQAAVNAFEDYKGADVNHVVEKLVAIAKTDKKSLVRADAISILSSIDSLGHMDIYKAGLNDPSFAVVGSSLFAYSRSNAQDKSAVFSKYEDINNSNVVIPLANFYVDNQAFDKYDWFETQMKKLDGPDLYYLMQYFGQYLLVAPQEQKEAGATILKEYAINHTAYYVRLAAVYSMFMIKDNVAGMMNDLKEIKEKEQDPRLLQMYENF
ncbi:MAG: M1 family metallopeptidase [Bacteroidota bacterium]|nr:M1 family metallopeptidase [Bacteroidota bacterium]